MMCVCVYMHNFVCLFFFVQDENPRNIDFNCSNFDANEDDDAVPVAFPEGADADDGGDGGVVL